MDGVIDVFVNDDIALQTTKDAKLDESVLTSLLAKEDVKLQRIMPTTEYLP